MTTIWTLDSSLEGRWSDYVQRHPQATIFHELAWRDMLVRTFPHVPHYLLAEQKGRTVGVLPIVEIRSIFFGVSMVSLPFGVYGGILADDPEVARHLADAGRKVAMASGAKYVELRHLHDPGIDLPSTDLYVTFIADVPATKEECLNRIPRKARAEVRKALARPGLTIDTHSRDVEEFYLLFANNKRSLGSPIFPKSLFWRVLETFGERCFIMRVRYEGETVAAVMSLVHRDWIMPYYSGAADNATELSANNVMYHALMEWACEHGLKKFDFGRSRRETGSYFFKKNQGFEPTPLRYQYLLDESGRLPSMNPDNPKFNLARRLFKKLPLPVAEKLGSFVSKRMPV